MEKEDKIEKEEKAEKEERVSLFTVREVWGNLALTVFSLQVIVYAYFLIRYEVAKGNAVMETLQVLMAQLAAAMAVATGITLIFLQGVDFIMFLSQMYRKYVGRQIQEAKTEGKAEGIAEGKAEGIAEERELWIAWNNRRLEAEAKGEAFNEPPPTETQNLTE